MAKRREREYTPEEAIAITLHAVTPHWYQSPPLVVGVDSGKVPYPQPLDPSLQSGNWVIFFVSSTSPVFDRVMAMLRVWERRFSSLGVRFILCFNGGYSFYNERKAIEQWLMKLNLGFPAVCDYDGTLAHAFGVRSEPGLAILHNGNIIYSGQSEGWLDGAEEELNLRLREESPGLPLWPVAEEAALRVRPLDRWELHAGSSPLTSGKVELVGTWNLEEDRITTSDSKAELRFIAPGNAVEIVARSLSDVGDPTRIFFDSQGASFSDDFAGKDFSADDLGNSGLVVSGPRGYSALRKLPPALRTLRFRFPFAKVNPVALYGLEFGESS